MPHARRGGIYVWPSAFAKHPSAWTAAERRQLLYVHGADEIRAFERQGAYTGYRVGIRGDGAWLFFVAGD
jgi:hypothetical protein